MSPTPMNPSLGRLPGAGWPCLLSTEAGTNHNGQEAAVLLSQSRRKWGAAYLPILVFRACH